MLPSEIISSSCERLGIDPQKTLDNLAKHLQDRKAVCIKENNTLAVVLDIGDNVGEFHIYSMDKPRQFVKSLAAIVLKIKATNLAAMYGKPNNEFVIRAFELIKNKTGIQISPSDKPNYSFKATRA